MTNTAQNSAIFKGLGVLNSLAKVKHLSFLSLSLKGCVFAILHQAPLPTEEAKRWGPRDERCLHLHNSNPSAALELVWVSPKDLTTGPLHPAGTFLTPPLQELPKSGTF